MLRLWPRLRYHFSLCQERDYISRGIHIARPDLSTHDSTEFVEQVMYLLEQHRNWKCPNHSLQVGRYGWRMNGVFGQFDMWDAL